jgi:LysM repeat protein
MKRRWLDRIRLLTRSWQVRRPTRVGRVRAGLAVLGVVAASGAAYTVQDGDTLSELAQKYGVSVDSLVEANSIENPNHIVVGQRLTIPGKADAAGSAAASTTSSPGGGGASTHVVQRGESLAAIARRFGLTVEQLATANGITDVDTVWAGSLLRVAADPPPTPGSRGGSSTGGTHTIAAGESLSSIAGRYGTTISALVEANGLADANRIIAGQTLTVPGSSGGGAGWSCPIPGGTFINDFGVAKPGGRYHEGIDVFAPRGTLILAPVGGTIENLNGDRGGLQFFLAGDDGYTYIGTHLDSYGPGGRVEQGDPIGTVGTSGNARGTKPHMHFEMHNGSVVNPYPSLRESC